VGDMNTNHLWEKNHPAQFWQITEQIDDVLWQQAITNAIYTCQIPGITDDIENILKLTLGEERYGQSHWDLSSFNRLYWWMKPVFPKWAIYKIRSLVNHSKKEMNKMVWPIDNRYVYFLWETIKQLLILMDVPKLQIKDFWPDNKEFALILTHDVETIEGQGFIPEVADLEEYYGFRSLFNIVGDQFPKDSQMLREIKERGFEIGIHGWHHSAGSFYSHENFLKNAQLINSRIASMGVTGHRSPLNLRNPVWMQALNIDYDLSFFDTDPFEPIPGGSLSIWPFFIGHFVELPATLVQDNTLVNFLGEESPKIWVDKIQFIRRYHGMALLNSHPDYLRKNTVWKVYKSFLENIKEMGGYWNALPREISKRWRYRTEQGNNSDFNFLDVSLENGQVVIH
jgi:peptidoglycan/xylan/chitin deacetylase (PgdA/CDA1 family)